MRIFKTEPSDVIEWQLKILRHIGEVAAGGYGGAPQILSVENQGYFYGFVNGWPPHTTREIELMHYRLRVWLWDSDVSMADREPMDLKKFEHHVLTSGNAQPVVRWWLDRLMELQEDLHPANLVHGDSTVENVVVTGSGQVYFIDPSPPRGLCCVELDESKMLQSLWTGWEWHKRGWEIPNHYPFAVRPVHLVLLALHWIRLSNHPEKHTPEIIQMSKDIVAHLQSEFRRISRW